MEAHLLRGTADAPVQRDDREVGHQRACEHRRGQVDRVEGADGLGRERSASPLHDLGVEIENDPVIGCTCQYGSALGGGGLWKKVRRHRPDQDPVALDQGEAGGQHQRRIAEQPSDFGRAGFVQEPT